MRQHNRFIVLIVIIVLLSLLGVNLTQAQQEENSDSSPNYSHTVNSPWRHQVIQSQQDPALNFGSFISLALRPFDNQPNIAHYRADSDQVILATPYSGNCGVNGNWRCTTLEYGGEYLSMDMYGEDEDNYRYVISYYDIDTRALKLYWFRRIGGVNSVHKITIQSGAIGQFVGLNTSVKFNSAAVPSIMYHVFSLSTGDSLRYAYPVTSGGNCGEGDYAGLWQCDVVDRGDGIGDYVSFDMTWDDQPYVAYYDAGEGNLKFAYYGGIGDCWNNNGWICTTVDGTDGSDVGKYASLKAPQSSGAPIQIAYYDQTNGHLKFYSSEFGAPFVVDEMTKIGFPLGISLDIDKEGYPVIAYQQANDYTGPMLGIAHPYLIYNDNSFGNCGDPPPGYLFQYWRCKTILSSDQYTEIGDVISMKVRSDGMIVIAYSEFDTYNGNTNLNIIYQYSQTFLPLLSKP